MKKFMTIVLCILLVGTLFVSCGKKATTETKATSETAKPVAEAKAATTTTAPAPAVTTAPAQAATTPVKAVAPATTKQEVIFRVSNQSEPESLDPALIQGVPEHRIYMALFEGLVAYDPITSKAVPGVAESWTISDDGTQYTFKIRKNAMWSDGTPITAHDVVYSWLRELNPATASPYAWFPCMFIKGASEYNGGGTPDQVQIKAVDDYTFQMNLLGPLPYALDALAHYSFAIVPQHAIEKYGNAWTDPKHFVGNGPYVLSEHIAQSSLTCVKNDKYWDKDNVKLDKVVFYASDNDTTNFNMYLNGEIDWATNVPLDQIKTASMRSDFQTAPQLSTYYYVFQCEKSPTNNVNVRKALALAVDRQALVDGVTKAGQVPAWGIVTPMSGYEALEFPNADDHKADIAQAQKLLADAGYPNGTGFPTVTILYNTSEAHKKVAEFIQQEWKNNLGINVVLENQEWQTYLANRNNGNFQIARAGWVGDYQDPNTFLDMFITGGGMNGGKYANDTYDVLINEAARMPAGEERFGVLKTAEDIMINQDQALMPLYYYVTTNMIDTNKWGGWHTNTMDIHPVKNVYHK